jgi:hypothetical protein
VLWFRFIIFSYCFTLPRMVDHSLAHSSCGGHTFSGLFLSHLIYQTTWVATFMTIASESRSWISMGSWFSTAMSWYQSSFFLSFNCGSECLPCNPRRSAIPCWRAAHFSYTLHLYHAVSHKQVPIVHISSFSGTSKIFRRYMLMLLCILFLRICGPRAGVDHHRTERRSAADGPW